MVFSDQKSMKIMNSESVEMLVELDRETDGTLVLDLIRGYRADLPRRVASLKTFFDDRNAAKLSFEAHAIKSTFANFGAETLAAVMQAVELSAKSEDWAAVSVALEQMHPLINDFNEDITELEARAEKIQLDRHKAS
ncbi:hypothetical protein BH10BDE1_BH10BDE1_22620 [soil metagenome]